MGNLGQQSPKVEYVLEQNNINPTSKRKVVTGTGLNSIQNEHYRIVRLPLA